MKKFRLGFLFILLALVLAVVPAALAQDETFGLSQTDYDLWTTAWSNLSNIDSASYSFTASFAALKLSDTDVTANLKGTGVLGGSDSDPMFQLDLTGTAKDGEQSTDLNISVRVVGGYLYYNDGTGWKGESLESALGTATSMFDMGMASTGSDATIEPSQLQSGDLSGLAGMSGMGDALSGLGDLKPGDFVSVTRTDSDGQALFAMNIDIVKLLSSPAIAPLLAGAMGGDSSSGEMTDQEVQQMGAMMGMMFANAAISFDQYVDTSAQLLNRAALNVNLPLDSILGPGASLTLKFDLSLSDFNAPVKVEAPADAVMMDASGS